MSPVQSSSVVRALAFAPLALFAACGGSTPRNPTSNVGAPTPNGLNAQVDSVRAAFLADSVLAMGGMLKLRIVSFRSSDSAFVIHLTTIQPEQPNQGIAGGGGVVMVYRDGRVVVLRWDR